MMTPQDSDQRPAPRLPKDPAYWARLSDRIVVSAAPILEEHRTWAPWWSPLDRFAPSLGLAAAAAVVAVMLMTSSGPEAEPPAFALVLAPDDPVAARLVLSAGPPDIITLLTLHPEASR
jgi:hypothetical protein